MAWSLKGKYFENCSCEVPCPCTVSMALGADYDQCRVILVWHVDDGEIEGTDVSGLSVAGLAETPKVMSDGNWRLGMIVDSRADDEQADKLAAVYGGQLGGPMQLLMPLVGENLGVERAPIEFSQEGRLYGVRIGDGIDVEVEEVVPFGGETPVKLKGIFHPTAPQLTIAKATRSRITGFGLDFSNAGKAGFTHSSFAWSA
ncbi:MAG TPA: DUF1326 domain-containing protein [Thermoleophilaceae bacterium]|jgi:hypothetical protein